MKKRQQQTLKVLAGIVHFFDRYAIEAGPAHASSSRLELDALVKSLTMHGRAQAAATGELRLCTLRRRILLRELYTRHLRPIVAIARAELADASAFDFSSARFRGDVLRERAVAIAHAAAKHQCLFLRRGLAPGFVEQFRATIDAIDRLGEERWRCATRREASTAALALGFRRATRLISVLDALVHNRAGGCPAVLSAWAAVRRGEVPDVRRSLEVSRVA